MDEKIVQVQKNPDSIEIGTPGKGGCIKIYGDFSEPETFKTKILEAKRIKEIANAELGAL